MVETTATKRRSKGNKSDSTDGNKDSTVIKSMEDMPNDLSAIKPVESDKEPEKRSYTSNHEIRTINEPQPEPATVKNQDRLHDYKLSEEFKQDLKQEIEHKEQNPIKKEQKDNPKVTYYEITNEYDKLESSNSNSEILGDNHGVTKKILNDESNYDLIQDTPSIDMQKELEEINKSHEVKLDPDDDKTENSKSQHESKPISLKSDSRSSMKKSSEEIKSISK